MSDRPKEKWKADIAWGIARDLRTKLFSSCWRIEVAGSLRRRKEYVGDIELLCIPRYDGPVDLLDRSVRELMYKGVLETRKDKRGRMIYGKQNKLLRHSSGIGVDIFSTTDECWVVALVVRTGGFKTNIHIASRAKDLGLRFHAYGKGFTGADGQPIVCHTEEDVFKTVGLAYKEPWERE